MKLSYSQIRNEKDRRIADIKIEHNIMDNQYFRILYLYVKYFYLGKILPGVAALTDA